MMEKARLMLLAVCLMGTGAYATILADGDFESGGGWPEGWIYTNAVCVEGAGVEDSASAQTNGDGASIHGLLNVFSEEVGGSWDPGQEYICTFTAKNTDGSTNIELGLLGPLFADWEVFTLTTEWQTFTGSVYFPDNATTLNSNADVFFYQRGTGSVLIDNVTFTAVVPEPATMVLLAVGGLALRKRR